MFRGERAEDSIDLTCQPVQETQSSENRSFGVSLASQGHAHGVLCREDTMTSE